MDATGQLKTLVTAFTGYRSLVIGISDDALIIQNTDSWTNTDLGRGAIQHFRFADGTEWDGEADQKWSEWRLAA